MKIGKPSYEEFAQLVKDHFAKTMTSLSKEQVEDYLNSEEAQGVIKEQYIHCEKRLERGEITESVFRQGGVYAASNCLDMLY